MKNKIFKFFQLNIFKPKLIKINPKFLKIYQHSFSTNINSKLNTISENNDNNKIPYDRYMKEVEHVLNKINDEIDSKELEIIENITLVEGVLKITFIGNINYVLNIQRPNLQLWLSSPFSGPQRFEFDLETNKWLNIRNKRDLLEILNEEINGILSKNKLIQRLDLKY